MLSSSDGGMIFHKFIHCSQVSFSIDFKIIIKKKVRRDKGILLDPVAFALELSMLSLPKGLFLVVSLKVACNGR